jgi:hypothetical protein
LDNGGGDSSNTGGSIDNSTSNTTDNTTSDTTDNTTSNTTDNTTTSDPDQLPTTCPYQCVVANADCRALGGVILEEYTCISGICCQSPDFVEDEDGACNGTCMPQESCTAQGGEIVPNGTCGFGDMCCDLGGAYTDTDVAGDSDTDGDTDNGDCGYTCVEGAVACVEADGQIVRDATCPDDGICCKVD